MICVDWLKCSIAFFVCLAMHAIFLFASLVLGLITRQEDGIEGGPADRGRKTVKEMINEECWGQRGVHRSKCVDRVRVFKTSRCGIVKLREDLTRLESTKAASSFQCWPKECRFSSRKGTNASDTLGEWEQFEAPKGKGAGRIKPLGKNCYCEILRKTRQGGKLLPDKDCYPTESEMIQKDPKRSERKQTYEEATNNFFTTSSRFGLLILAGGCVLFGCLLIQVILPVFQADFPDGSRSLDEHDGFAGQQGPPNPGMPLPYNPNWHAHPY